MIQPHCMGLPFPKRDTDSPGISWISRLEFEARQNDMRIKFDLPSAADLDAVAEEQRVKEKTGMYYDKDGWYPPS